MIIERKSPRTGKINTMNLSITLEQIHRWESGIPAQLAFPGLTAAEREFFMTGFTQEDWDWMFPPEPDDMDDDMDEDMEREGP
jgi:hypothetical protein